MLCRQLKHRKTNAKASGSHGLLMDQKRFSLNDFYDDFYAINVPWNCSPLLDCAAPMCVDSWVSDKREVHM